MILENDNYAKNKILNAIIKDPEIVVLLKEKYVDEEIWKYCIEREPSLFKKMKHPSESICMFACEIDGSNLRYIRNKFNYITITNIMAVTAVKSNPKAILFVPNKLIDESLKELAFDSDPSLMLYYDDIDQDYIKKLLHEKPYAIQYVKELNEEIICDAIRENPNICAYIKNMTGEMLNTLEKYHPNYYNLYKNSI